MFYIFNCSLSSAYIYTNQSGNSFKGVLITSLQSRVFVVSLAKFQEDKVMSTLTDRIARCAVPNGTTFHLLNGSPFVTCSRAESFARQGQLVLIVDLGLTHPTIHNVLQMNKEFGLTSLLVGRARTRDVIQRVRMNNRLCAITAGITVTETCAAELLNGDRMFRLLENLGVSPYIHVFLDEHASTQHLTYAHTPRPRYGGIGRRGASRLVDA